LVWLCGAQRKNVPGSFPGLVCRWQVEPVIAIIIVDSRFVDDGVCCVYNLMIGESVVACLSVGWNLLDAAVECLNWLVWVPVFIKAFGIGSEVDWRDVAVFVKEVLDEDLDGDIFIADVVVMVSFQVCFFDGIGKFFL
jgi:hypothetical protein